MMERSGQRLASGSKVTRRQACGRDLPGTREDVVDALTAAMIDALGSPNFHEVFLRAMRRIASFDMSMIAVYDESSLVSCFVEEDSPLANKDFMQRYREGSFRYNPFFQHHLRGLKGGIYLMRELARPSFIRRPMGDSKCIEIDSREEIGFITPGWPRQLAELNIAVRASDHRIAQIALYRMGQVHFSDRDLVQLHAPIRTISAIYRKHLDGVFEHNLPLERRIDAAIREASGSRLSPRERQIIHLIARGKSASEIVDLLGIGAETLRTHRKRAYQKLNVGSRVELLSQIFIKKADPEEGYSFVSMCKNVF